MLMHLLNKRAKDYIKEIVYGLHPLTGEIHPLANKGWVVHRSMVSNEWGYCYFRIPKSAGSTIARSLAYYDPTRVYNPAEDIRGKQIKKDASYLLAAKTWSLAGLVRKYFLFTFVRNPYTRILSAYLDKIARLENTAFQSTRDRVMTFSDTRRDLTFETFIRYLEKEGLYKNPHWIPQIGLLPVRVDQIHFIGKVENLDNDLRQVMNRIYGEGVYQESLTRQHGRTDSTGKMMQYYDRKLLDRVYQLYQLDFASFSYPKDWSVNIPD